MSSERAGSHDTYLPAFQALVQEGQVAAVMGAYNRVYGESASASSLLLQKTCASAGDFQGYVVSDCDSIEDIYKHHKIVSTAAARRRSASAKAAISTAARRMRRCCPLSSRA